MRILHERITSFKIWQTDKRLPASGLSDMSQPKLFCKIIHEKFHYAYSIFLCIWCRDTWRVAYNVALCTHNANTHTCPTHTHKHIPITHTNERTQSFSGSRQWETESFPVVQCDCVFSFFKLRFHTFHKTLPWIFTSSSFTMSVYTAYAPYTHTHAHQILIVCGARTSESVPCIVSRIDTRFYALLPNTLTNSGWWLQKKKKKENTNGNTHCVPSTSVVPNVQKTSHSDWFPKRQRKHSDWWFRSMRTSEDTSHAASSIIISIKWNVRWQKLIISGPNLKDSLESTGRQHTYIHDILLRSLLVKT